MSEQPKPWLAVQFAPQGSNDPAIILGLYSTRELAKKRLEEHFDDDNCIFEDFSSYSRYGSKHRMRPTEVFDAFGMVTDMKLDEDTNIDV